MAQPPYYQVTLDHSPRYGHHHHLTLLALHLVPSSSPHITLLVLLVRVLAQPREELRRALDGHTLPLLQNFKLNSFNFHQKLVLQWR